MCILKEKEELKSNRIRFIIERLYTHTIEINNRIEKCLSNVNKRDEYHQWVYVDIKTKKNKISY